MRPTRWTVLVGLAVVAGVAAYLVLRWAYSSVPPLPGYAPVTLTLVALVEVFYGFNVRGRLRRRPGSVPVEPLVVARLAALAKASSHAASLIGGAYAGFFVFTSDSFGKPQVASDAVVSAFSAAAAGLLVGAALFLEHQCRVPKPPEGDRQVG